MVEVCAVLSSLLILIQIQNRFSSFYELLASYRKFLFDDYVSMSVDQDVSKMSDGHRKVVIK